GIRNQECADRGGVTPDREGQSRRRSRHAARRLAGRFRSNPHPHDPPQRHLSPQCRTRPPRPSLRGRTVIVRQNYSRREQCVAGTLPYPAALIVRQNEMKVLPAILISLATIGFSSSRAVTLDAALAQALKNNPRILQARAGLEAAVGQRILLRSVAY